MSTEDKQVSPERLIDLMTLVSAFSALTEHLDVTEKTPVSEKEWKRLQYIHAQGQKLLRFWMGSLHEGLLQHLAPIMERSDAAMLKPTYKMAVRSASPMVTAINQAKFLAKFFPWLRAHQPVFNNLFTGRAARTARLVIVAIQEDNPTARLNQLAAIPAAYPSAAMVRKWMELAAEAAGVPVSTVESVEADADAVKGMASEVTKINGQLRGMDPQTQESVDLKEQKQVLQGKIDQVVETAKMPEVVMAAAVVEKTKSSFQYATETGKRLEMTPDQEDAMVTSGKAIIAAGAGSGKTRVMAGKVVYTVRELGIPAQNIIATSFSRKSAHELKERVAKFGGEGIFGGDREAEEGFGTTHHVAGYLLRKFSKKPINMDVIEGGAQKRLLNMAIAQVGLRPAYGSKVPDVQVDGLFPPVSTVTAPSTNVTPEAGTSETPNQNYTTAVKAVLNFYEWLAKKQGPAPWLDWTIRFLQDMVDEDPTHLNAKQKESLNKAFGYATGLDAKGQPNRGRPGALGALERAGLKGYKVASLEKAADYQDRVIKSKKSNFWFETPANQWFNLGTPMKDASGLAIGPKRVGGFIGKAKANLQSPTELWHKNPGVMEAAYGAYEWLKDNAPEYASRRDHDDTLIEASKMLISDPKVLAAVQSQYKVVLVDEAQDENKAQHLIFGLITGSYDPATRALRPDGKMTASTYCLIGDDKQCLDKDSMISTPSGDKRLSDIREGDTVLSYRNGRIAPQRVNHARMSSWKEGLKVTLEHDRYLIMSPNHKLWAGTRTDGLAEQAITLLAHTPLGSEVSLHWTGSSLDEVMSKHGFYTWVDASGSIHKKFKGVLCNYREALLFTEMLSEEVDIPIRQLLHVPYNSDMLYLTAENLTTNMYLPVKMDDLLSGENITAIEKVPGEFIDLDVEDASNFFGNGVLTHNSIFAFRGASPTIFIENSDKLGGQFKTKMLDTNFRSGKEIVEAANRLIKFNKKQIPMECKSNPDRKGLGVVQAVRVPDHEYAALITAEQIAKLTQGDDPQCSPKDFGVAVRTNAEAYAFGVELLKLGIPFRSKVNFFNDATTRSIVSWMRLANAQESDRDLINDVVLTAHEAPSFGLDKVFENAIQEQARGQNYLHWLESGGWEQIYEGDAEWRNRRRVLPYMETLRNMFEMGKIGKNPAEIIDAILNLRGPSFGAAIGSKSLIESLIDRIKKDPDALDLLSEETESGEVTTDAIRGLALAPVQPLISLVTGYKDLGPALGYINKLQKANEKKSYDDDPAAKGYSEPAVVIDTCHGWKGLESKHMYVPMAQGTFPHAKSSTEEAMEEERRLAYVAITRGMDSVTILCPIVNHLGRPAATSQFVSEACIPGIKAQEEEAKGEEPIPTPRTAGAKWSDEEMDAYLEGSVGEPDDDLTTAWFSKINGGM